MFLPPLDNGEEKKRNGTRKSQRSKNGGPPLSPLLTILRYGKRWWGAAPAKKRRGFSFLKGGKKEVVATRAFLNFSDDGYIWEKTDDDKIGRKHVYAFRWQHPHFLHCAAQKKAMVYT